MALPENISQINSQVFQGCVSLRDIYIPKTVKKIDTHAFDRCTSLSNVYFGGSEAMWNEITISTKDNGNKCLTNPIMNRYWNQNYTCIR